MLPLAAALSNTQTTPREHVSVRFYVISLTVETFFQYFEIAAGNPAVSFAENVDSER